MSALEDYVELRNAIWHVRGVGMSTWTRWLRRYGLPLNTSNPRDLQLPMRRAIIDQHGREYCDGAVDAIREMEQYG